MDSENSTFQELGNLFRSSYEISRNILKRLTYRDLRRATQVCKTWNHIGKSILEKDRSLGYTIAFLDDSPTSPAKQGAVGSLERFISQVDERYCCCLGFANGSWLTRDDIRSTKCSPTGDTLFKLMKSVLPAHCCMGLVCANGVIGTLPIQPHASSGGVQFLSETCCRVLSDTDNINVGCSFEVEGSYPGEDAEEEAVSFVLFPKQPGVNINVAYLDEEEFYKTYRPKSPRDKLLEMSENELNAICRLESGEDIKALLVFYCDRDNLTKALIKAAISRQSEKLALGGGQVDSVQQMGNLKGGTIAVTICGGNVRASSVVVPSSVKTRDSLNDHLIKLKEGYVRGAQHVCFVFSCCGRGSVWYMKRERQFHCLETGVFRSLFPDVPILGYFGGGEAGINYVPDHREDDEESPRKRRKKMLFHSFTSIFILVAFL